MVYNVEEGDIVLCTVTKIIGTHVFVKVHLSGKEVEGNIIFSEIAPGRIRNIREYAVPKKKIVCKVLRIHGDRLELSLRRVTQKEKKEVLEKYKQEKSYKSIFKRIVGDKSKELIKEIEKKSGFYEFIENSKGNPEELEKIIGKEKAGQLTEIIKTQKKRKALIKKHFSLISKSPEGIYLIKDILNRDDAKIKYVSAGKYSIEAEAEDMKSADNKIKEVFSEIDKRAKKQGLEFNTREK